MGGVLATPFDIIRLVAVPVFVWAAWRDLQTRRVPNEAWIPLLLTGVAFLPIEAWLAWGTPEWPFFSYPVAVGLGIVSPVVLGLWYLGGFGGGDAKAIITLAVLFPTYPTYYIAGSQYPLNTLPLGSVAVTVLTNATVGLLIVPLSLATWNTVNRRLNSVAPFGKPEPVERIDQLPGKLLENPHGLSMDGLDLDALRMYLRWRGITVSDVCEHTEQIRRPGTVPSDTHDPTDGAVRHSDRKRADRSTPASHRSYERHTEPSQTDDEWGAQQFLEEIERHAYDTSANDLRDGLEVLAAKDTVWVSPGLPFLIPVTLGLITALAYGNIVFGVAQFI